MAISDETWNSMLNCACQQFEGYVRADKLKTPDERRIAIGDALQQAVGIMQLSEHWNKE